MKTNAQKLEALRGKMKARKVDAYLVPREDEWQGEYVPPSQDRLSWLTGFTGSAGLAVILASKAAVYTDGRYEEQIKTQVPASLYDREVASPATQNSPANNHVSWLTRNLKKGQRVGYDPKLHTVAAIRLLRGEFEGRGIKLVPVKDNLVDMVWSDRPAHPDAKVTTFPTSVAGLNAKEKRKLVAKTVKGAGAASVVLTAPDSIAWLLNIRGNDVPHVPVALSYAVLHDNGNVDWFVPEEKISTRVRSHMGQGVRTHDFKDMEAILEKVAAQAKKKNKPVMLDADYAPDWFRDFLTAEKADILESQDPCVSLRAVKTPAEQKAIKDAHVQDGVALVRFLKWVDEHAPKGKLTELDIDRKLLDLRGQSNDFRDTSFDTIAGWKDNGAVIHYRATEADHKKIKGSGLLLVDSGGQYKGGTTDITRTIAVGKVTKEMTENFTRVLKGHIGIARLCFPEGTTGKEIEPMARQALWDNNLDFKHGTGHGVGCYLSVHERGTGISKRASTAFKPGMLVSNEPGYYKPGAYGIRIENLVMVEEAEENKTTGAMMMQFNTVSLAPIDLRLVQPDMLSKEEAGWLNDYHDKVRKTLNPHLNKSEQAWLKKATKPVTPR